PRSSERRPRAIEALGDVALSPAGRPPAVLDARWHLVRVAARPLRPFAGWHVHRRVDGHSAVGVAILVQPTKRLPWRLLGNIERARLLHGAISNDMIYIARSASCSGHLARKRNF